ncbi:MAG: radical SAM family heme chaperone HemW [Defluviitaleaceae bacterium]|nr:radical SAM family heme chaperone HemW [Defluviitaleaceae bacterium]
MRSLSIYIHIPFCRVKCIYCDFLSFCGKDEMMGPYVDALCADIAQSAVDFVGYGVVSVFFGGGTPTTLTVGQLERIVSTVRRNYSLASDISITTEANPETVDLSYLTKLKQMGFNRISIGVQSFDGRLLSALGRVHSAEKAVEAVKLANRAGFDDINIDLMFALPHQSLCDFRRTLAMAVKLPITHISCYALTVEDGTALAGDKMLSLRAAMPDEAEDRDMYHLAKEMLAAQGFEHYEISNWAKRGFACRHNLGYWTHREYVGFGVNAHGFVQKRRICKTDDIDAYIGGDFSCKLLEEIDKAAEMTEFVILGLRLIGGIDTQEFAKRFGCDIFDVYGEQLEKFAAQGLLCVSGPKIALTPQGVDLSNTIFADFL